MLNHNILRQNKKWAIFLFPQIGGSTHFFLTLTFDKFSDIRNVSGMVSMTRRELFLIISHPQDLRSMFNFKDSLNDSVSYYN